MATTSIFSTANLPPALTARERAMVESYLGKAGHVARIRMAVVAVLIPAAIALFAIAFLGSVHEPRPASGFASLPAVERVTTVG